MLDVLELLGGESGLDLRASIVLTYSLDLPLYDGLVRRTLARAGILNQAIFCDLTPYNLETHSQAATQHLGIYYSVTPLWQTGSFHPKVYLLLGPRQGRMLIGSGNATSGGLLRNAEVFGLFGFDKAKDPGPHPGFAEVFDFIQNDLAPKASETVRKQLQHARQIAPWLDLSPIPDNRRVLIGGPGRGDLLDHVIPQLPQGPAERLVACSSSFDRKLAGIERLKSLAKERFLVLRPDTAELDGESVRDLTGVGWRVFVDPHPEQSPRKDLRAHAKLFVLSYEYEEFCFFGSANASRPALDGTNTEIVVAIGGLKSGEIVGDLGLGPSLAGEDIRNQLESFAWPGKSEPRMDTQYTCLLSSVAAIGSALQVHVCAGTIPPDSFLALSERILGKPDSVLPINTAGGMPRADGVPPARARFAWAADGSGKALSNSVAITWSSVVGRRSGGHVGSRYGDGLEAMGQGLVLGTVLFELLDHFPDFEVRMAGGRGVGGQRARATAVGGGEAQEQESSFFYTDQYSTGDGGKNLSGDRVDLDILASLVQPLSQGGAVPREDPDDDSRLAEEEQRRIIDANSGKASGDEVKPDKLTSSERLAKAVLRLEKRLDRAASVLEKSLGSITSLSDVSANSVARQIWMTHIGAFLAGRKQRSSEGQEFICLRPWVFARYVLRVCRALTGSRTVGGFLDRLPTSAWQSVDGESLKAGLSFLCTCALWAATYTKRHLSVGPGNKEAHPNVAVASPELVAARFWAKAVKHCGGPVTKGIPERLPAWNTVSRQERDSMYERMRRIVRVIRAVEDGDGSVSLGSQADAESLPAGALVVTPVLGVTMLAKPGYVGSYFPVNLSDPSPQLQRLGAQVRPVLIDGQAFPLFQRIHVGPW